MWPNKKLKDMAVCPKQKLICLHRLVPNISGWNTNNSFGGQKLEKKLSF